MYFLGIDPGVSGAWAVVDENEKIIRAHIYDTFCFPSKDIKLAVIEKVHSMPKQGVASVWTFAENYGFWKGLLTAELIPFNEITPQRWQGAILDFIPAREVKDPNETTKEMAKRLAKNKKALKGGIVEFVFRYFPQAKDIIKLKKDYGIADALCLALYAKRVYMGGLEREKAA